MVVAPARSRRLRMPLSRGAVSGVLLIALGLWAALIPFIGPYFDWAYQPDRPWVFSTARSWLEVLPGVVAVVGGLLLLLSTNRATAMLGGLLAVTAGTWLVVGRAFAPNFAIPDAGQPVASTNLKWAWLEVSYFSGVGLLMVFLSGVALARLAARTVHAATTAVDRPVPAPGQAWSAAPAEASATGPVQPNAVPAQRHPQRPRRRFLSRRRTSVSR